MACFFKIRRPISEDYIDGFANLRYEHQLQIREKLGKKPNFQFGVFCITLSVSHAFMAKISLGYDVNGVSSVEQPPRKKFKVINAILERQIQIQNHEFFAVYDKLKGFADRSGDCQAILKSNNQFVPEHFAEVSFE